MVELETEVCLAAVQLYLEKTPEERTEKLEQLAKEGLEILSNKQSQFTERDKELFKRGLEEIR